MFDREKRVRQSIEYIKNINKRVIKGSINRTYTRTIIHNTNSVYKKIVINSTNSIYKRINAINLGKEIPKNIFGKSILGRKIIKVSKRKKPEVDFKK